MNDYDRIATVIRHLDVHHGSQPSLSELAAVAGLSESHFHRLFHRWAGITPKDFLQCLTAEFVKAQLRQSASVLDSALIAGLSGPGRVHDLMVTLEAASPGELKRQGAGLTVHWGIAESPFGLCSLGWSSRGICHLAFRDQPATVEIPAELRQNWSAADFVRDDRAAQARCQEIFRRDSGHKVELRAFVRGTVFQIAVWRALLRITPGGVASYGHIAQAIGRPKAVRAVGGACGDNPVAFLIPCHRVIRETGIVRGYRWGDTRKRSLLAWEAKGDNGAANISAS